MNAGIIGCGNISGIYLQTVSSLNGTRVTACADLNPAQAEKQAEQYGVRACTVDALLADPDIGIVVNLTVPNAHADVAIAALEAGKHVYNEKPLAVAREDARRILETANRKGLRVGCAPDTVLGAGIQTCRGLIDRGAIGTPILATAFMIGGGPEPWHPDPDFFFQPGGGPMLDVGPYYVTALVTLLGPIRRITGSTGIGMPQRTVGSGAKAGQTIDVNVSTTVVGALEFHGGVLGNLITTFDVKGGHHLPRIEIHGTEGSLSVPDPNTFDGPVRLLRAGGETWTDMDLTHPHTENTRGLGVADMAAMIAKGEAHRANGDVAYHVLDAMHAFQEAADQGKHIELQSTCARPDPMPAL